jgi:2-methylcitrate dehydratase PrpD
MGGFIRAHAYKDIYDSSKLTRQLGQKWMILDTSVKVHACCAYLAPVVDCALEVALKYDVKAQDVQEVIVKTCQPIIDALMEPKERKYRPQDVVDAQFSIPYGVGVAICRRVASPSEFEEKTFKDPQILEVASKVRAEVDPEAEKRYPDDKLATAVIRTKDGKEYSAHTDYPKGDVENPVSDAELEAKFRMLTRKAISEKKASEIIQMVWQLDELKEINRLTDLIC